MPAMRINRDWAVVHLRLREGRLGSGHCPESVLCLRWVWHTWQVEMVLVVAQPFDPDDDEAINGFVETINKEVVDID